MSTAEETTSPSSTEQKNVNFVEDGQEQESSFTPQDVETRLLNYLQGLFDVENLKSNAYIVLRLSNSLELDPTIIYTERNVQNICQDPNLIDQALEKVNGIQYQRGSLIRIKANAPRRCVIVKNITAAHEQQFQSFIKETISAHGLDHQYEYNAKNQTVSVTLPEEASAVKIFSQLLNSAFNGNAIDCLLKEENLYVELLESVHNNKRSRQYNGYRPNYYPYAQGQYQNNMYGFSSQPMPMFYMPYAPQMFGKHSHYIRKSKDNVRSNQEGGSPANQESGDQNGSGNQYDENNQYNYSGNGSGYRSSKPYYKKRYYNNGGRQDGYDQDQAYENREYEDENGNYNNYNQGERSYQRRDYQDKDQKRQRNKKVLSTAEIEKVTTVDADNYPPLA